MYKIYCELRDKNEKKDADVAKATGITKSTFSDWKSGRSTPKQDKLQKIAEYFNVSVDYLMTGNNDTSINSSTSKFSNKNSLTTKDEKDIRKKVDDILSQLNNDEALMFDGEPMNDETKELPKMPSLWTRSYFVSTAGNVCSETIKKYVENQKKRY